MGQIITLSNLPEEAPYPLKGDAAEVYKQMLPLLRELGCRAVDINKVVTYCQVVALKNRAIIELDKFVDAGGTLMEVNGKIEQKSRYLSVFQSLIKTEKEVDQDMGTAPAVRRRLKQDLGDAGGDDPNQLLMFG